MDDALLARLRRVDPRTDRLALSLRDVDKREAARIADRGKLVFHVIGCSGDPDVPPPQNAVEAAMAVQLALPGEGASFLYHLGDIAYKLVTEAGDDQPKMDWGKLYKNEFYKAYEAYARPIFAISGNHDGKYKADSKGGLNFSKSGIWHFLSNFCDDKPRKADRNPDAPQDSRRRTMTQPYPFWLLDTPAAVIMGLYTNVLNGGALDLPDEGSDPVQYRWLISRLAELKSRRTRRDRAVRLALHYPPFSGTPDFLQRGDPQSPHTPGPKPARWLWQTLLAAFEESGVWPDAVLSAHAHLYPRIIYRRADRRQIPFVVIGTEVTRRSRGFSGPATGPAPCPSRRCRSMSSCRGAGHCPLGTRRKSSSTTTRTSASCD